ncbi:hypothetical protein [Streptomyces pratensis]|uniref:hypothetical protein n=1 Tax=Streptomyces pratensis TaxID=1169025 RepID=UPI0036437768
MQRQVLQEIIEQLHLASARDVALLEEAVGGVSAARMQLESAELYADRAKVVADASQDALNRALQYRDLIGPAPRAQEPSSAPGSESSAPPSASKPGLVPEGAAGTVIGVIAAYLADRGEETTLDDITRHVQRTHQRVTKSSVSAHLSTLRKRGGAIWLRKGVYQAPEKEAG